MATTLPTRYPLSVYTGATFRQVFRWKPDGITGQDLTGWTAILYLGISGRVPVIIVDTDTGITLDDQGTIGVTVSAAATRPLKPGVYQYNLDLIDAGGYVIRFARGRVDVIKDAGPV